MEYQRLMPWATKLTLLVAMVALMGAVYIFNFNAPTPATAGSNRVVYVPNNWSLSPNPPKDSV